MSKSISCRQASELKIYRLELSSIFRAISEQTVLNFISVMQYLAGISVSSLDEMQLCMQLLLKADSQHLSVELCAMSLAKLAKYLYKIGSKITWRKIAELSGSCYIP